LPMQNVKAQSDKIYDVTNENVYSIGASYTILQQSNIRGYGANVNTGFSSYVKKPDSKLYGCASFLLYGDVSHFNTKDNRFKAGCLLRLGGGYDRVALMYVKESGICFDNHGNFCVIDGHGGGVNITFGPYTKLFVDCVYSWPLSSNQELSQSDMINQKYAVRIGIIHTLSRRINQK